MPHLSGVLEHVRVLVYSQDGLEGGEARDVEGVGLSLGVQNIPRKPRFDILLCVRHGE